jgi:hypothetical protein
MPVEQFPFIKGDLAEADFGEMPVPTFNMWEIQGKEDIVIREESDRVKNTHGQTKKDLERRIEIYKDGKKLFHELRDKYNINVIPFGYIVGKADPDDSPQVFSVTKKIFGKNIRDISRGELDDQENKKFSKEADQMISSLAEYAKDKYANYGNILNDVFHYHQYVFGKKTGDKENKIYLVDIEPLYIKMENIPPGKVGFRDNQVFNAVQSLQNFISCVEQLTHMRLISARKKLDDLFNYVLSSCLPGSVQNISVAKNMWEKTTRYNEEVGLYK